VASKKGKSNTDLLVLLCASVRKYSGKTTERISTKFSKVDVHYILSVTFVLISLIFRTALLRILTEMFTYLF